MHALFPLIAHVGHNDPHASGFLAGLTHPWFGLDHLLAMVAVGLLAVLAKDKRALWLVPACFVGGLVAGGLGAFVGMPLPGVEYAIAASVIVLALAVAGWNNVKLTPAVALVALAGAFHGYAHVAEMVGHVLSYGAGMALGTALLHALGVAAGLAMIRLHSTAPVRVAGAAIAVVFALTLLPV